MENSFSCEWSAENSRNNSSSSVWFPANCCDYPSSSAAAFLSWPTQNFEEERSLSASKSHSEAEKRRRDRINAQLATLRKLIPMSEKMDKAALLSNVVEHVKELKRKAKEISKVIDDVPSDTDQVTVDDDEGSLNPPHFFKVSICCDDRPELFAEINRVLKDLGLTTVHVDITSMGGRVRSVFVLVCTDNSDANTSSNDGISCINSLKQSLKVALCKIAIPSSTTSYRIKSKRQRFFLPAHFH